MRQRLVVASIAKSQTTNEIADHMKISPKTVYYLRDEAKLRLGLGHMNSDGSVAILTRIACAFGEVDPDQFLDGFYS